MSAAPNLIIQLQRMGDLILSFPLFAWLAALEPEHPVWVVAEPLFYEALMPLCPSVTFFPPEAEERLRGVKFHRVINLSHRPEAARMSGSMQAETHLGALEEKSAHGPVVRVRGAWHLYRASLTHNNRHNHFHWADLNALDVINPAVLRRSVWPVPRVPSGQRRVGLFVGASQADKRPEPEFWGALARQLMRRGCRPVFLGGKAEKSLGSQAARLAGVPQNNLCGLFSLSELAQFMTELDLLVSPDTGPMHVGAWSGTLSLNLSMGPVNAWETAPFPPGHLVLRPTASCQGCWRCERLAGLQTLQTEGEEATLHAPPCKQRFVPERIASLVYAVLRGDTRLPVPPGLELRRTCRSAQGLFKLEMLKRQGLDPQFASPRDILGEFWQQWFLFRLGTASTQANCGEGTASALLANSGLPHALAQALPGAPGQDIPAHLAMAMEALRVHHPQTMAAMQRLLPRVQARFAAALRRRTLPPDFWRNAPPLFRPLTGYVHMLLENGDLGRDVWADSLEHLEHLARLLQS